MFQVRVSTLIADTIAYIISSHWT